MGFFLEVLAWLALWAVVLSFVEHWIHRHIMHRGWGRWLSPLRSAYHRHAVQHHHIFYREFDHEPDPAGREISIYLSLPLGLAAAAIAAVPLWFLSPAGSVTLPIVVAAHHLAWNLVHGEMHKPTAARWRRLPAFEFLARHHYLHHRYPGTNFNALLPLADFVLGTTARPTNHDRLCMHALGIYWGPTHQDHTLGPERSPTAVRDEASSE